MKTVFNYDFITFSMQYEIHSKDKRFHMISDSLDILVLSSSNKFTGNIISITDEVQINADTSEPVKHARSFIKNKTVPVIIIDGMLPDYDQFITEIFSTNSEAYLIIVCDPVDYENTASTNIINVKEILKHPVTKTDMTLAIKRATEYRMLACKAAKPDATGYIDKSLFIQQFVTGMSTYIEKIAENVQGGIKFFNELPYCVSIHDNNCNILSANNTYKALFGDKTDNGSWEIYDGNCDSKWMCPVGLTIQNKDIVSKKCIVTYDSGAKVPVLVHTTPIFNNNREIEFILEVFAGTNEIDKMSSDFSTTQQNYHQLFDAVPSYIAVLNKNKQITEVNRRFKEDFGDQAGRAFFDVLKPASIPVDNDPVSKVMSDGAQHQEEMVLTSDDGTQYNMMTWAAPVNSPTGKLLQVLVVLADKTEMRTLKDNLSSLGLMLGTLSHNLKGSLTGLDAGLYLIDTGFYRDIQARIEEGLDVSKLMVDRIRKMVFNVLYYAKERGVNLTKINISQFAADVAAHVDNRIRGGHISFECDFPKDDIICYVDPDLLRSALINILENAREVCISDQTEKSYEIIFRVFSEERDVVFEINDNGSGMDEEQKKQLFSIFSSSKGLKGTGLGLFITHEVIKKHNGSISVESEPGKGTCFSIKIPKNLMAKPKFINPE